MLPDAERSSFEPHRRRAFFAGVAVVALGGAFDLATAERRGLALGVRAIWIGALVAAALLQRAAAPRLADAAAHAAAVVSGAATAVLASCHGAARDVWLGFVAATPLVIGVLVPGLPSAVLLAGAASVAGGVILLARGGAVSGLVVEWATLAAVCAGVAAWGSAFQGGLLRREWSHRAAQERSAAELASAERRRSDTEHARELRRVAETIAHEVNNPLAFVKGNVEWVREQLDQGRIDHGAAQGALEEASVGIARVARAVRELRARARRLEDGGSLVGAGGEARHLVAPGACDEVSTARLVAALLASDRRSALDVSLEVLERDGLASLYEGAFRPALEEVGRRWERAELGVDDEHLATALVDVTLASLYPLVPWPPGGPVAVVACAPRERHELGARMVADLLALDGWKVVFLGADTPADALARRVVQCGAALAALSVTLPHHLPGAREAVAAVRRAAPGVHVLAGGRAVAELPDPVATLGVDRVAGSCVGAVDAARACAALRPRA